MTQNRRFALCTTQLSLNVAQLTNHAAVQTVLLVVFFFSCCCMSSDESILLVLHWMIMESVLVLI